MADQLPSRRKQTQSKSPDPELEEEISESEPEPVAKTFDLSGRYRVREGYSLAHGPRVGDDANTVGKHGHAKAGELVLMTHEEALTVIRLTKDQKDNAGRPNGPAIEREAEYQHRMEVERQRAEFEKQLMQMNNLPDGV